MRDTGHWSFADDCALIPDFADGCGGGARHDDLFATYDALDNEQARQIAAHQLVSFFGHEFLGSPPDAQVAQPSSVNEIVQAHPALP